ncbi:hypothetical protein U713_18210 [Rhodobacter capsulatus YW2]|nr:hypothetical protein U713_18210 [Rhodobacter capsulatus YW2]
MTGLSLQPGDFSADRGAPLQGLLVPVLVQLDLATWRAREGGGRTRPIR